MFLALKTNKTWNYQHNNTNTILNISTTLDLIHWCYELGMKHNTVCNIIKINNILKFAT